MRGLKVRRALKPMSEQDPLQWPTTQFVIARIKADDNNQNVYQGTVLHGHSSFKAMWQARFD